MEQVKYVYSIGCSYTGGTGLENYKDRFSYLLSQRLEAEEINEGIDEWLPYINLREIDVTRDINLHTIRVYLKFTVTTTGANMVINILANENQLVVSEATSDAGVTSLQQVGTFGGGSMGGFGGGGY